MLSNVNQTINLTAGSVIDGNVVLLMSANIRTGEAPVQGFGRLSEEQGTGGCRFYRV